jgi:hypothetical protein
MAPIDAMVITMTAAALSLLAECAYAGVVISDEEEHELDGSRCSLRYIQTVL